MTRIIECEGDYESIVRAMNLITFIRKKCIDFRENFVILAVGMPGKGKTMGACTLGQLLDPTFDESRVCVSYQEFFGLINDQVPPLPPGSVIVYDEFQQSANSRDWQNVLNRAISDVVNTFRSRRLITIITTPRMGLIDKNVRSLLNMRLDFKKKNMRRKVSTAIPYFQEVNNTRFIKSEAWEWIPRITEGGVKKKMNNIEFSLPSLKLRRAVDLKIDEYKRQVSIEAALKVQRDREDVELTERKLDFQGIVDIVRSRPKDFMGRKPGTKAPASIKKEKIMLEFGIGNTMASNIVNAVTYL